MGFRIAALIAAACSIPGVYNALQGAHFEEMLLWLAIGAGGAGIISSFRLWPMTWFTPRGEERVARSWGQVVIDAALVVGLLAATTAALVGLVAAGILYPNAARADWGAVPVVALVSVVVVMFGVLAGVLILIPVGSLLAQLGRATGGKKVDARIVWGGLMLLSVVVFGILAGLAIDSEGPTRGTFWRSLPTLLFGLETSRAEVRSEPALWAARVAAVVVIVCVVGLVRAGGGRRVTGPGPRDLE